MTGRKRNGTANASLEPDESFDLTDGSFEISPPKRSRRAADKIETLVTETVDLEEPENEKAAPVEEESNGRLRSGRLRSGRGKASKSITPPAPQPKNTRKQKLSYRQALKLIKAPIPPVIEKQVNPPSPPRQNNRPPPAVSTPGCDVDLTGDVKLGPQHSTAPLFQKNDPKKAEELESEEDDDMELTIKINVKYGGKIKPYKFRLHQRFFDLYKRISEAESIPINNIYIYDGDKRIDHDETPHTVEYRISKILLVRVMESKSGATSGYSQLTKKNHIDVKFQSDKWKKPIVLKISKFEDFKTAVAILCEQIAFKPEQVTLRFDGDLISLTDTPTDLDFEGGECVDVKIKV